MNTKKSPYIVQLVGGPSDGLVLSDPDFTAQGKLWMGGTPALVRRGGQSCRELVGYWSPVYRLTSRERGVAGDQPTTRLRYDFLGYELLDTKSAREPVRHRTPRPHAGLRIRLSQLGRRFASWLLEPIDHPLRVPVEQPNSPRADVVCGDVCK
jgi:hypothetical protein